MAQIVNKRPSAMEGISSYGSVEAGPRIYDDSYGDHNAAVISSRFHTDGGGMSQEVEEDLDVLREAARKTFGKRKPILDWKTKNQSFIDVHNDLRRLGIKNNTFFLKLYDKDLQGVDPYSPALPLEMQIKVYIECVVNPWYYLREFARIPADAKVYIACSSHERGKAVLDACDFGCIAYGKCVRTCPANSITMQDNLPVIAYDKCITCGKCAEACPRHTIKVRY